MDTEIALFLDRDGVINYDFGYVHDIGEFEFIPGVFSMCKRASALGYKIIVVTNQSGIGRRYYSEVQFLSLTSWMLNRFEECEVNITAVYYCPTHPTSAKGSLKRYSFFRKPDPGMILQAAKDHSINIGKSVLIGDQESDITAGIRAGIGTNLLFSPRCGSRIETQASSVVHNLNSINQFL